MLRNNADARRCSYFELGLPVVKVVCFLPIPLSYAGEITMTVGRCTELEELFA